MQSHREVRAAYQVVRRVCPSPKRWPRFGEKLVPQLGPPEPSPFRPARARATLLDLVRGLTDHEGDVALWHGDRVVCVVKHPSGCCIWM
jgi:hypothetical protein